MKSTLPFAGLLALLSVVSSTPAEHIPGHSDGDPTFPVPMPDPGTFSGGIIFMTSLGPPGGSEITHATYDITWVSDGSTPASDLGIEITVHLETGPAELLISGADLGFGSGPGTFHGKFETDAFNGVAVTGFFPPYSIVNLNIGGYSGGQTVGYFEPSYVTFDVNTPGGGPTGDINDDGVVNGLDLGILLANWSIPPGASGCGGAAPCESDLNGDGVVDGLDLGLLLANWTI